MKHKMRVIWQLAASRLSSGLAYLRRAQLTVLVARDPFRWHRAAVRGSAVDRDGAEKRAIVSTSKLHAVLRVRVSNKQQNVRHDAQKQRDHEAEEDLLYVKDEDHPPNEDCAAI